MRNALFVFALFYQIQWGISKELDHGVIHLLEDGNKQSLLPNFTKDHCHQQLQGLNQSNPTEQARTNLECTLALCGSPAENVSVFVTDRNFNQYTNGTIKTQLDSLTPNLIKSFDKIQNKNVKALEALEKQIIKNGKLDINPSEWSDEFKEDMSLEMFSPYLSMSIDYRKPISERFSVKINSSLDASDDFKKNLEVFSRQYESYVKNSPNPFLGKGLYTPYELNRIATLKMEKIKKDLSSHPELFGAGELKGYNFQLRDLEDRLKSVQANQNVNIASVIEAIGNLEMSANSHFPDRENSFFHPMCSNKNVCNQLFKNFFEKQNIAQKIKLLKSNFKNTKLKEQAINRCKAQVTADLSIASDKKQSEDLLKSVIDNLDKKVLSKFSSHSRGVLQDYFQNKLNFFSEKPSEKMPNGDPFKGYQNSFQDFLNDSYKDDDLDEENALKKIYSSIKSPDSFDLYEDKVSPCASFFTTNAWDSYNNDQMYISEFTCHHDLRGKSIVAHELGHAINELFYSTKLSTESAKFYKELRQCVTENYLNKGQSFQSHAHSGDGAKTEEDMADLFAYMTYSDSKDIFSCALLRPSLNNQSYEDLDFILNDKQDVHSSSFLRVVMEAINKNIELPISCQKALVPYQGQLKLKKCSP